ncbi:hypothetical protein FISHEDRAFT_64659 [Fistulina hepatica ATCC 64428]|uniref:Uncharacterized protein n=1 Tax=Fistulina hepatica ATCC 64428 TaxID=1128425 RepID=A0A0D7AJC2_9AGAR|nr:hypothetical protein FISHEDRAFT_64659 [Fistulina hepatica ATCC 64428]
MTPSRLGEMKKKKKRSKNNKCKQPASLQPTPPDGPPVLRISRNKHWKYISSYHGPWLQLPIELLESLLVLNIDPTIMQVSGEPQSPMSTSSSPGSNSTGKQRERLLFNDAFGEYFPHESSRSSGCLSHVPFLPCISGKPTPPPIDPGVLRCITSIRRLVDEASELSVRAASGLPSSDLGMGSPAGVGSGNWAIRRTLGCDSSGQHLGSGHTRNVSAVRVHRLRVLAVQKLAQAYRYDEIASSVMVMQGGGVFEDIAERVLKIESNNIDAKYVHFFHEKIPSRRLAESTSTQVLDELIEAQPHRLEFYRTRGVVHCFRDEYPEAIKDFTFVLKEARRVRMALYDETNAKSKHGRKKRGTSKKTNGQAPPDGTSAYEHTVEGLDGEPILFHPSVLPDAPDPIEPQSLFLRGAAHLQHALHHIETAVLKLENVVRGVTSGLFDQRLCHLKNSRYGGVEIGGPDGPLGPPHGAKAQAYRRALADPVFRQQVHGLVTKAIRDHEKFLAHFDSLDSPGARPTGSIAAQVEYAFLLSEADRPGNYSSSTPPNRPTAPPVFTTYHPLLAESHYTILICHLLLGDFASLLPVFVRTVVALDGVQGYTIFLPARSVAQAEFIGILERLAGGWRTGVQPHSEGTGKGNDTGSHAASSSKYSDSYHGRSDIEDSAEGELQSSPVLQLEAIRMLLSPVAARQRKNALNKKANSLVPPFGPRIEIILAWLGAVHLYELDQINVS